MLSQIRLNPKYDSPSASINQCVGIAPSDAWSRDMQEDMKTAIDLLWKFKAGLDKLHPDCLGIIERMISLPNRNY